MKYTFSAKNSESHILTVQVVIDKVNEERLLVQLPAWRPGRYELANFAKNIQQFQVMDQDGQELKYTKLSKDLWEIRVEKVQEVVIEYTYYSAELNAGSTYLSYDQMYVNPVNCCLYCPNKMDQECVVHVDVPYPYEVATGMERIDDFTFRTKDFHELADSPFIASPTLQHEQFDVQGIEFHIWFQGEIKPNWAKIQMDFERFANEQIDRFGTFPRKQFHFLFQITPYRSYHGVEHQSSTVCLIGPGYDLMSKRYIDFLGVSSHELYHVWNVKTLRPDDMSPYDYTRENYSRLGYVYEGVTTYMGDKLLFASGVIDETQYFKELETYLDRHIHNGGRFNMSVADSSFDTWLDGYISGVPDRKTSIYTEGCLFSFILDVALIKYSSSNYGLSEVMKRMYVELASAGKGYSREDYIRTLSEVAEYDMAPYFELVETPSDYIAEIEESLNVLGLELEVVDSASWTRRIGLKGNYAENGFIVSDVALDSDAYQSDIIRNDKLVSVNGFALNNDLNEWLSYFGKDKLEIGLVRNGQCRTVMISPDYANGFKKCRIRNLKTKSDEQSQNFELWLNN